LRYKSIFSGAEKTGLEVVNLNRLRQGFHMVEGISGITHRFKVYRTLQFAPP
jgi:hypothetical protein